MTETRAEAQRLVDEGRVTNIISWTLSIEAQVRGEHGLHRTILYHGGHFYCSCAHGAFHSYTDDLCAHALAVKLAVADEAGAISSAQENLL